MKAHLLSLFPLLFGAIACKAKVQMPEKPTSYSVKNNQEIYDKLAVLKPGDSLLLADGEYTDLKLIATKSGLPEKLIIIAPKNPGKVFITGDAKVEIRAGYTVLKGLYFKNGNRNPDQWKSHGPGVIAIYGSHNRVTECVFDNFDQANSAYITTSLTASGQVPKHCRIDHCVFVGKTTLDQVINLNNGIAAVKDGSYAGPAMYHRVDHCFFSNPPKKGNAGGGIRIGYYRNDIGRCLVDSNLFYRQDSEAEIITSKSQENVFYANTIVNCQGTLNFRHGDKQVALNNFYISTDDKLGYGGMFIWGSKHTIANNYFSLKKTIASRGNAALYFNPGAKASEHALAFDILLANNMFKDNAGYAINFEPLLDRRIQDAKDQGLTFFLPYGINATGNAFIATASPKFDLFLGDVNQQKFENNYSVGISKNYGLGIKTLNANIAKEDFYRPQELTGYQPSQFNNIPNIEGITLNIQQIVNSGIKGKPLSWDDVRPSWLLEIPNDYWKNGE